MFAAALLQGRRSLPGPGFERTGRPTFRLLSFGREWDLSGLQAILPVPLLRSSTPVEPMCPRHLGHIDAAHALRTAKASAIAISGLVHAASAPADLRFAFCVATHAQGSLPAGWLAFAGRASNPLDRDERFQLVFTIILLSCPPDASAISAAHCAAPSPATAQCANAYCALRADRTKKACPRHHGASPRMRTKLARTRAWVSAR